MKSTPLQQAQSLPSNDSITCLSLKPAGLGMTRTASIMSHSSHVSDSGSTKARNSAKPGRHWLGRSRSQPRLPLHLQDNHISVRSDWSSMEERARSPLTPSSVKVVVFISGNS